MPLAEPQWSEIPLLPDDDAIHGYRPEVRAELRAYARSLKTKLKDESDPDKLAEAIRQYYPDLELGLSRRIRYGATTAKATAAHLRKAASEIRKAYSVSRIRNREMREALAYAQNLDEYSTVLQSIGDFAGPKVANRPPNPNFDFVIRLLACNYERRLGHKPSFTWESDSGGKFVDWATAVLVALAARGCSISIPETRHARVKRMQRALTLDKTPKKIDFCPLALTLFPPVCMR
jgi:hypothetical protein